MLLLTSYLLYNGNLTSNQQGDSSMFKSKISILAFVVIFLTLPFLAFAGVPDVDQCDASMAYSGPGTPSLLVVPDGDGNPFTEAHDEEGNMVDATITLIIRDGAGDPIINYPFEDAWLESEDHGMVACVGGAVANASTDVQGMTYWSNPMFAGGYSQAPTRVFVNGLYLPTTLALSYNSPDINGDGAVNLSDIALFSIAYFSGYQFRCDYNGDGELNLADVTIVAEHIGASCP